MAAEVVGLMFAGAHMNFDCRCCCCCRRGAGGSERVAPIGATGADDGNVDIDNIDPWLLNADASSNLQVDDVELASLDKQFLPLHRPPVGPNADNAANEALLSDLLESEEFFDAGISDDTAEYLAITLTATRNVLANRPIAELLSEISESGSHCWSSTGQNAPPRWRVIGRILRESTPIRHCTSRAAWR
ncbi:hypothetical protein MMC22_010463 [Lobaria immixta]|nr:hypothetical protein [Lobaria immixta]